MKIALISKEFPPSPHSYGIGTYTDETARSLARLGHTVTVICAASGAAEGISTDRGVRIVRLPDQEFLKRTLRAHIVPPPAALAYRRRVAETLDRVINEGDAEIVEFPGYRGESHTWLQKPRRIAMVARMHGFTGWVYKTWRDQVSAARRQLMQFETQELLAADCVTLVADHLRAAVEQRVSPQKVVTLYNGIDAHKWIETSKAEPKDVRPDDIVYVGSLTRVKGVYSLLEAAKQLHERGAWKGRLVLFGRADKEFTRYAADTWGTDAKPPAYIDLRGQVARDQLPPAYRTAGVCCFPSFKEPFNYTAIEASACGGLIVGSTGTGMQELVLPGETGFLLAPGDPAALAQQLAHALALQAETSRAMRMRAQQRILENFDQDVLTQQLLHVYQRTMDTFYSSTRKILPATA